MNKNIPALINVIDNAPPAIYKIFGRPVLPTSIFCVAELISPSFDESLGEITLPVGVVVVVVSSAGEVVSDGVSDLLAALVVVVGVVVGGVVVVVVVVVVLSSGSGSSVALCATQFS